MCNSQCNVEKVGISMQNYKKIYNQHANTTNRIVCVLYACLTQVTVQMAALHIVVPTSVPGVFSPCSSLPGPLSSRCEGGRQFHSHGPAIFPPAATYDLSHLIYLSRSHPRWLTLHVNVFQSPSIERQECDLELLSHLQDK